MERTERKGAVDNVVKLQSTQPRTSQDHLV
jgi:hypothetical protein